MGAKGGRRHTGPGALQAGGSVRLERKNCSVKKRWWLSERSGATTADRVIGKERKKSQGDVAIVMIPSRDGIHRDANYVCCCCQVTSVVSNSVQPHRQQPTRLPRPWNSLGKNTGVGCHFLLQCVKVKSESEASQSCLTLSDAVDCSPPGSSVPGIFQARILEWGVIAFSANYI